MNTRCSIVFLMMVAILGMLVAQTQARIGEELDETHRQLWGGRGNADGTQSKYADWPTRCCGQNNNADCLCPIRKSFATFKAATWDAKCAEYQQQQQPQGN